MKWIVGLDLRPSSQGAVAFARWVDEHSIGEGGESFVAVHILEEDHMRAALRYHHLDEVVEAAEKAAKTCIDDHEMEDRVEALEVVRGLTAEDGIEEALERHGGDAIVVGRQAARESNEVVRLGRVARRLVRSMVAPVIVVPPDMRVGSVGDGPILALTKLTHDSIAGCEAAVAMGKRMGRPVCLVHVVPFPEKYGAHYLPQESLDKLRRDHEDTGAKELQAWAEKFGFKDADRKLLQGHLLESVREYAAEVDAALIVTGSRRLTGFDRLFLTSRGSELCAHAAHPVMVVPPGE
jgi:nucleotide-binding universal stress UspA family protein